MIYNNDMQYVQWYFLYQMQFEWKSVSLFDEYKQTIYILCGLDPDYPHPTLSYYLFLAVLGFVLLYTFMIKVTYKPFWDL